MGQFYVGPDKSKGNKISLEIVWRGNLPFDDDPKDSNEAMLQLLREM